MRDLKKDFGFLIGPWNQAYMCDTLPIRIDAEGEMKPGDLVFISGTYYNTKSERSSVGIHLILATLFCIRV